MRTLAAQMSRQGWTGTITVLHEAGTNEFLARNLFPVGRITEDPVTGSAAASTGAYLRDTDTSHGASPLSGGPTSPGQSHAYRDHRPA